MTQQENPGRHGGEPYGPPPGAPQYGGQQPQHAGQQPQYAGQPPAAGYAVPSGAPGYGHIGHPAPGGFAGRQSAGYVSQQPLAPNGQPLADVWMRLLARLLDGLIIGGALTVVAIPLFVIVLVASINATGGDSSDPTPIVAMLIAELVFVVIAFAAQYVYEVEMTKRTGQTIGKRVLKLRVTPLDPNQPLNRGVLARRWLVSGLGGLIPGLSILNVLWCLWDQPYRQCLHDKFAKTVVVKVPA